MLLKRTGESHLGPSPECRWTGRALTGLSSRWTVVTEMSVSRSAAGVAVFDGRVFVSGGHDGLQIFNTVGLAGCSEAFRGVFLWSYLLYPPRPAGGVLQSSH